MKRKKRDNETTLISSKPWKTTSKIFEDEKRRRLKVKMERRRRGVARIFTSASLLFFFSSPPLSVFSFPFPFSLLPFFRGFFLLFCLFFFIRRCRPGREVRREGKGKMWVSFYQKTENQKTGFLECFRFFSNFQALTRA